MGVVVFFVLTCSNFSSDGAQNLCFEVGAVHLDQKPGVHDFDDRYVVVVQVHVDHVVEEALERILGDEELHWPVEYLLGLCIGFLLSFLPPAAMSPITIIIAYLPSSIEKYRIINANI